ncbi:GTPase-activator protein for Ras-like GTPase (macronuclear) [Tetrahymena thermophila SB210]|uniref:GTPase-activator protein for Ras-like GTPase n=1 Tax=Tetrahymena thermophila (strain SB210) TaxID=312017 RepID=Q23KE1_TETTS|nr:GTPase-activator protein for Ras-like GTPase [Tetrahymena thermophila SB210]EAR96902.2 GTPase-activator protein for Ras-like GTPase [Tetrahymena thermophila SB210]|eukprot:XP_001017147.2 GTPase-activator protein for Ras-like GTPase [Tetrahymena thermophila SB210]
MINGNQEIRKESLNLLDSPQADIRTQKQSVSSVEYTPSKQDREKKMQNMIQQLNGENIKIKSDDLNNSQSQDSHKNTPSQHPDEANSNKQQTYTIKINDIEDSQNGRLQSRLNTYDLKQQFFKSENQYPQHLFEINPHIAQWGRLQDNIKSQYLFLKQENEIKNQMIEDLKLYQLKMIKNNLKYKFLLKERSRYSMVYDKFQDIRPKMKINIQNFDTNEKSLVDTINKNQDLLKSMMLKIAQNPLLLAYIIEQNNQYDNNLDQFLDDVNSLFYERVLVDNQYHNPIYILQAYLIDRELSKAQSPDEAFKISNLSIKTIYAFSKNINCVVFLEKILYKPLKQILGHSYLLEVNLIKLYDQLKKSPRNRRDAMNISNRPSINIQLRQQHNDSPYNKEKNNFTESFNSLEASSKSTASANNPSSSKNPITQFKNFIKTYLPMKKQKSTQEPMKIKSNEIRETDRSASTFVFQNSLSSERNSSQNFGYSGRRERRRKLNQINGNVISQSQLKEAENFTIEAEIVSYLKKNIEDIDLQIALDVQYQANVSLTTLSQLVKNFMNQILTNVRNFPKEINIMCCILKRSLLRHFPLISTEEINIQIRQFVFNKWIFQDIQLINQRNIMTKKEQETLTKNFHLVNRIAQQIVKQMLFDEQQYPFLSKLNQLILSYKPDLDKFYEIISTAENTLIDLILDKSNLENATFTRSGQLTFQNTHNSSQNSKGIPIFQLNQQSVQDVTSLAFSLEDLRIITLLISKMPDKLEKFDSRNILFKEAQKLQDKLKDVFKDNLTSRNSYYFIWEAGTNQSTGYIEKLFQIDYGLSKKEKKELNQQQLNLFKIKEMLILFLLSIDSILYLMQLKRGQEITLQQILDEYKIKQIDHIISIRLNQPKVQMDIYLEYLQLLLHGLPENLQQNEYECILKDICLTLDRKFSFLTQQILAYKQLYLQKKNIIKNVILYVKEQQESIIKKNIKQNAYFFIRNSYINIKIITTKIPVTPQNREHNYLNFQIIQNEQLTVKDTESIARKKEDMLDEFKNGLCPEEPAMCFSIQHFINYLIYTPELMKCIEDRSNLTSFNQLIGQYFDLLEKKVEELPFYQNMKEECKKMFFDLIEKHIAKKIFNECMPLYNSEKDNQFIMQAKKYSYMSIQHQNIEKFFLEESMWESIAHDLTKINNVESHLDKLNLIYECFNNITQVMNMVPGEGNGADDCFPIWVYILLKAQIDKIFTNINFIELMTRKNKTVSDEIGYVFAQFQSAAKYIYDLTEEQIYSSLNNPDDIEKFSEYCKNFETLKKQHSSQLILHISQQQQSQQSQDQHSPITKSNHYFSPQVSLKKDLFSIN